MEQMTIFDFIQPKIPNKLDELPEEDMVELVSRAVGLNFVKKDKLWGYVAKRKGIEYTLKYSYYAMRDNHDRFISCGYSNKSEGSSGPHDTIEGAIEFFKRAIAKEDD